MTWAEATETYTQAKPLPCVEVCLYKTLLDLWNELILQPDLNKGS